MNQRNIFSCHGRIDQLTFAAWYGVSSILTILIFSILDQNFMFDEYEGVRWLLFIPIGSLAIPLLYMQQVLIVQRLHDCNLTGWWSLIAYLSWVVNFITDDDEIFGLILLIELGFKVFLLFHKEDIAINRFGIKHIFRSGKEEVLGYLGILFLFGSFIYQVVVWF